MKTLFYPAFDRMEIRDEPVPSLAPGEVLLKVAACGLCGSELETFKNHSPRRQPPLIMGHEFCGTITELGPGVNGMAVGQRVVSNSLVPCDACPRCQRGDTHLCAQRQIFGMHRPGAFCEYVNVPAVCLLPWPDKLSAEAACLAEPLANGVHMVNLTRARQPRQVLVLGAGPIGLMAQQAFQALLHCQTLVADLLPQRRAVAGRLGAQRVIDPRAQDVAGCAMEFTRGQGVDLVIDAVGSQLTKTASLHAVRPGGAVVWIGLHEDKLAFDSYDVTLREKTIIGTYAAKLAELSEALGLMAGGQVDVASWVEVFPLERGVEAFGRMLAAGAGDIKGVIKP